MFLHESLNDQIFASDKKLNLLKRNVITLAQFINLIELTDNYQVIGPAMVAKPHKIGRANV